MHVQVLGEIFNAIHRADLGGAAEKAADPQLPRKVRLPAPGASPAAAAAAIAAAEGKPTANGGGSSACSPQSLIQRLFGLDMQVCAASPGLSQRAYVESCLGLHAQRCP